MANKPELKRAVAGSKIKANDYNYNFEQLNNYIENGIADSAITNYEPDREYKKGQWVLAEVDGSISLYESLVDGNKGNSLTDSNYWEQAGGGAGLEIGDIGFTQLAIDESSGKRRYLNGSVIIQDRYQVFTEKVKSSIAQNADLACTEEEWQNEVSATGFCGKYVVDDEAGTIRLPKFPEYLIAGLTNTVPVVGNGMALGLTDGVHNASIATTGQYMIGLSTNAYGKPYQSVQNANGLNGGNWGTYGVTSDATKSGIIAQLDEAGNKIYGTYFIQVATGASVQENITNEIELNNPFVLLEGQYFTAPVYNSSWLQSNTGFTGSLALHPTAYNALLIEQNPNVEVGTTVDNYTKRGLSVKLNTEEYTDYDFVLNTTSQVFRCPLKINKASGRAVVGNGNALGFDGMTIGTGYSGSTNGEPELQISSNGGAIGTTVSSWTNSGASKLVGVTTDPTKSGIETNDSDLYLYFYVGETIQNANLVNVGRVEEKLSDCLTRGNKKEIVSFNMPDYTAGVTISISTTNVVMPFRGILTTVGTQFDNAPTVSINDVQINTIGGSYTDGCTGYYIVDKDDLVKISKGTQSCRLFPFKGDM